MRKGEIFTFWKKYKDIPQPTFSKIHWLFKKTTILITNANRLSNKLQVCQSRKQQSGKKTTLKCNRASRKVKSQRKDI